MSLSGIAFGLALAVSAPAAPMHWVYEAAYPERIAGDYDAVLDGQGHLHIVYGRDALYYDWEEEDGWHSEMVDAAAAPASHDLVLDSADLPHVTYVDSLQYQVKYAHRDAEGWSVETIAQDVYCADLWSVISLDSVDRPQIGYGGGVCVAGSERRLVHLRKEASGWQATTLGAWSPTGFRFEELAIGIDGNDQPHLACLMLRDGPFFLFHTWRTASGWQSAEIPVPYHYGERSLLFDETGRLHFVYRDEDGSGWEGVTYVTTQRGAFDTEQLFRTYNWLNLRLAVSGDGVPHLIFCNNVGFAPGGLYHMSKVGTEWEQTQIEEKAESFQYSARLAVDEAGQPHVYYRQTHVWQDGDGWHSETEPSGPHPDGAYTGYDHARSRLLVQDNRLRMAYSFVDIGAVVYTQDATGWQERVIAQPERYIESCRLLLDSQDHPHMLFSYGDELMYVWRDADGWRRASVDIEGPHSGLHLALDPGGRPHIGCLSGRDDPMLKYAVLQARGWNVADVDTNRVSGGFSMAVDSVGRPHLGYVSGQDDAILKHAVLQDAEWDIAEVDANGVATFSMALDSMDRPHFLADESGVAVHLWEEQSGWEREVVPSPSVGAGIAAGREGNLQACGTAQTGENRFSLWHGVRTPEGWQIDTVADIAAVSVGVRSWVLDEASRPHIACCTYEPSGLIYAWQDATGYHVSTVESSSEYIGFGGLALGLAEDGTPSLAYTRQPLDAVDELLYTKWSSEGWQTSVIEKWGYGCLSSFVMDSQGRPHLAYSNYGGRSNRSYLYAPPFSLTGLTPLAAGQVRLHWQGALEGVGVDGAASLSGGWSPVAEDLSGLEGEVSVAPATRFFRLRQTESPWQEEEQEGMAGIP